MRVELFQGDCLEFAGSLEAESVDLVFADPPFNVGIAYGGQSANDRRSDYAEWCAVWIKECFRILKPTGSFYLMTIPRHLENLYPEMKKHGVFINQVNWRNVAGVNSGRCFWGEYQPILVYGKTNEYKFNRYAQKSNSKFFRFGGYTTEKRGQMLDYWNDIPFVYVGSIKHPEAIVKPGTNEKEHPAQMPTALPKRAILFSTDEGDIVYDPFSGSGTTAVACIQLNRNFIGSEVDPGYFKIAEKRIAQAQLQPRLFEEEKPKPKPQQGDLF